jgi:hypothetical protein
MMFPVLHLGRMVPPIFGYLPVWTSAIEQGRNVRDRLFAAMFFSTHRKFAREVRRLQPSRRWRLHSRVVLDDDVLAVLPADARALAVLRADDFDHQRHRVREPEGRAEGFRPREAVGDDWVDCRELAVHLHS